MAREMNQGIVIITGWGALVASLKCIPPAIFINLGFLHRNMPLHPVIFRLCLWAETPYLATVCSVTLAISTDSMAAPSNQSFILSETTQKVKTAQKVKIWQQNFRAPVTFPGFAGSLHSIFIILQFVRSCLWDAMGIYSRWLHSQTPFLRTVTFTVLVPILSHLRQKNNKQLVIVTRNRYECSF